MSDFPPVYVTTLRESFFRRNETQDHFNKQGIDVKWVNGINGAVAGLAATVAHDRNEDGTERFVHPHIVGCALTHVFALEMALASDADEFFVMEDDVVLCDGFKEQWLKVRATIPDVIQVVQCAVTAKDDKPVYPINEFIEHRYFPFCTACNWWRRSGAEFAVKVLRPFNSPFDIMLASRVYPFIGHAITIEQMAWDHSGHQKNGQWPSSCQMP